MWPEGEGWTDTVVPPMSFLALPGFLDHSRSCSLSLFPSLTVCPSTCPSPSSQLVCLSFVRMGIVLSESSMDIVSRQVYKPVGVGIYGYAPNRCIDMHALHGMIPLAWNVGSHVFAFFIFLLFTLPALSFFSNIAPWLWFSCIQTGGPSMHPVVLPSSFNLYQSAMRSRSSKPTPLPPPGRPGGRGGG